MIVSLHQRQCASGSLFDFFGLIIIDPKPLRDRRFGMIAVARQPIAT
jgi:hypothetical protein